MLEAIYRLNGKTQTYEKREYYNLDCIVGGEVTIGLIASVGFLF
jgi:hypothetical protein